VQQHPPSGPRRTIPYTNLLVKSILVLLGTSALAGGLVAWASPPRTYPGDDFTLRVDASSAIHREVFTVRRVDSSGLAGAPEGAEAPAEAVAPIESETETDFDAPAPAPAKAPVRDECAIPARAVSPSDKPELFPNRDGRFSKVPKYLVPFFEQACKDYGVPVRFLVAAASYETHFTPKLGDGGTSCGILQFRDVKRRWTNWGFAGLAECMDPEKNIRKAAENWSKHMKQWPIETVIRKHNGGGKRAEAYKRRVVSAAETYYR
jgi:hypothetical protein